MSAWLRALMEWPRLASIVACAAQKAAPGSEVYVTGGAAEGRLTAASDIDIVIVVGDRDPGFREAVELRARIIEEAERLGLPMYAPIDLHIVGRSSLSRYKTLKRIECGAQNKA